MANALDTYEIHPDTGSITPTLTNEGTNSARFALMTTLVSTPTAMHAVHGRVDPTALELFGINPDLGSGNHVRAMAGEPVDEVRRAMAAFADADDPTSVRSEAWEQLNGSMGRSARLSLLAAGLASLLERESVTAATAILTSTQRAEAPHGPNRWGGWPFRGFYRRIDSLRMTSDPMFPEATGTDGSRWVWSGADWADYCTTWLREAARCDTNAFLEALRFLAQTRIELGQRSADPIVRELAAAGAFASPDGESESAAREPQLPAAAKVGTATVSTMVHGTWGFKDDWWYPGGDFYEYIKQAYRPGLYGAGQEFAWSGAYSQAQRQTAGARLKRWIDAAAGDIGAASVFGHSYGAEVIARAVNAGAKVDEAIFLSAPIQSHHVQMLPRVRAVIDIRLRFDIALTAAGAKQRLPAAPNVTEFLVNKPLWSHGATVDPQLWRSEGIAEAVGLQLVNER